MKRDRVAVFLEKVAIPPAPGACWIWQGSETKTGYGLFGSGGQNTTAHRWFFKTVVAPVPDGLEVDHLCRVRNCVNPLHMEVVTHAVNSLRSNNVGGVNARKMQCDKGHPFRFRGNGHRWCEECRKEARRQLGQRLSADPTDQRHGTQYGYALGCRCDRCKQQEANRWKARTT